MPKDKTSTIDGEAKTVDIDDKGPGAEVVLDVKENENETVIQDDKKSDDSSEKSSEQLDVRVDKNDGGEVKEEEKEIEKIEKNVSQDKGEKEIEEYS